MLIFSLTMIILIAYPLIIHSTLFAIITYGTCFLHINIRSRDVEAVVFQPLLLPHLSLPLPPTKNEKTTLTNFLTFVGL